MSSQHIDVHHHIFPSEVMALQEQLNPDWAPLTPPGKMKEWTPSIMRETMDRDGLASVVISQPGPGAWYGDAAGARRIMRAWNEYAAGLKRDNPGRVGFLAMLAPPDVDGTLAEIAYAFDVLGADGVGIHSNYDGRYLGEEAFAPVFAELQRRKAVLYIHPALARGGEEVQPGVRTNMLEYPFDSTRNVVSLVLSGTLSRCPDIKFIISHGGGALPMMAGRIELLGSEYKGVKDRVPRGIGYELSRLYSDTAGTTSAASVAAAMAVMGPSRLLFGTDFPYLPVSAAVEGIGALGLAAETRRAIERDNALALFPRFA